MQTHTLEQLMTGVRQAVHEAAAFLEGEVGKVQAGQIEEKHLNGLVSYVDRQAETMLVDRLSALIPGSAFLTEEGTVEQGEAEFQWIIDPLDGTTNFLHQLPHFSVSVGLREAGELTLGVVHHVSLNEQFYAWQGGGAWCNGRAIRVSDRPELRQALISTGFPYHRFDRAEGWFAALRVFLEQGRGVRRFGSAALDLAYVACGRYDVFFEYGLSPWDVAGGMVLVAEAGGRVSDFLGGPDCLYSGEMLAASHLMHDPALRVVREAFEAGQS